MKTPSNYNKLNLISIMAGPAGGKGTQSKLLETYLNSNLMYAKHISTGDIIRNADSNDPEIVRSKQTGSMLSNKKMYSLFEKYLDDIFVPEIIVLDGMPREKNQTDYLMKNFSVKRVYFLDVDDETLNKRMIARGRESDMHELDRLQRIIDFNTKTLSALHQFPYGVVREINGKLPISNISELIKNDIKSYL